MGLMLMSFEANQRGFALLPGLTSDLLFQLGALQVASFASQVASFRRGCQKKKKQQNIQAGK